MTNILKSHRAMLTGLIGLAAFMTGSLHANTIGYWRFENADNLGFDSGPNGLHFAVQGTVDSVTYSDTGPGSSFYNPIPQTNLANQGGALFGLVTTRSRIYDTSYNALYSTPDFTIEAMFNYVAHTEYQAIAGRWQTSGERRGWYLRIDDDGQVRFTYSTDGTNPGGGSIQPGIQLEADKDYYLGVAFNSSEGESITFYVQNLTDGTDLTAISVENTFGALYDPSWGFEIGSIAALGTADSDIRQFQGVLDEVRYSSGVLTEQQLLASVPEPRHAAMVGALAALGLAIYLKRK